MEITNASEEDVSIHGFRVRVYKPFTVSLAPRQFIRKWRFQTQNMSLEECSTSGTVSRGLSFRFASYCSETGFVPTTSVRLWLWWESQWNCALMLHVIPSRRLCLFRPSATIINFAQCKYTYGRKAVGLSLSSASQKDTSCCTRTFHSRNLILSPSHSEPSEVASDVIQSLRLGYAPKWHSGPAVCLCAPCADHGGPRGLTFSMTAPSSKTLHVWQPF